MGNVISVQLSFLVCFGTVLEVNTEKISLIFRLHYRVYRGLCRGFKGSTCRRFCRGVSELDNRLVGQKRKLDVWLGGWIESTEFGDEHCSPGICV